MSIQIAPIMEKKELDQAFSIRHKVFVEEQNVPSSLETDEWDATATHFLAKENGQAVGTARLRWVSAKVGKVERVAVLSSHRGTGLGRALMDAIESYAIQHEASMLKLHAQTSALSFYRKLGYDPHGEPFMDAGIEHIEMKKPIQC
ncbi:GNAT family N-acetyltransferase [Melghirimyces algeriensis]|uniref:Predicted N-acyltransferase, GNAT family n=1 Tax=Melghirimyces algeriensis TaxID=910412 RepID=A0A521BPY5_9BACL|nr:GNAT family N-acetyltransferase [Melghirimyces algeriensis]SMO49193.1 Predicted N-acyltransferase, GNAT family [Melghirimyces algeriensis]